MSEGAEAGEAADQLTAVLFALDDVDLNALLPQEVRTLLDARDDLEDVCSRLRHDQHTVQHSE